MAILAFGEHGQRRELADGGQHSRKQLSRTPTGNVDSVVDRPENV